MLLNSAALCRPSHFPSSSQPARIVIVFSRLLVRLGVGLLTCVAAALSCSIIPTRAIWEKDPRSSSALFRVILNGKAGYIDEAGRVVIEPQFDPSYMRP